VILGRGSSKTSRSTPSTSDSLEPAQPSMNIAIAQKRIQVSKPIRSKMNIMNNFTFNLESNPSFGLQTGLKVNGDIAVAIGA